MHTPEEDEIKFCLAMVMLSMLYESWQRPGAVRNCKLIELHNGTLVDNIIYIVTVAEHKTGIGDLCSNQS